MNEEYIKILSEMDKVVQNKKNRHSYFQIKHFILGKELTHQSKLYSCVQEIYTRKESMEAIALELAELRDQIELYNLEIDHFKSEIEKCDSDDKYNITKLELKIRKFDRKKISIEKNILKIRDRLKGIVEEANYLLVFFNQLSKIEEIKDWDDMNVQLEYWDTKYNEELNNKVLFNYPIDSELIKSINALPEGSTSKEKIHQHMTQLLTEHKE